MSEQIKKVMTPTELTTVLQKYRTDYEISERLGAEYNNCHTLLTQSLALLRECETGFSNCTVRGNCITAKRSSLCTRCKITVFLRDCGGE